MLRLTYLNPKILNGFFSPLYFPHVLLIKTHLNQTHLHHNLFKPFTSRKTQLSFLNPPLMTTAKRPRYSNDSPSSSNPNNSTIDTLLESLITVVTDHTSIYDSIGRIIESKSTDSHQKDIIQRAMDIGSVLFKAGNRLRCKRVSAYNALVWPLPYDVTVKVFSMTDTQSVCNVAAVCSFFRKCAMDPLCFADIDLVTLVPKVNNAKVNNVVVSTMIQQAGNAIQSIKLGVLPHDKQRGLVETSIITSSCLSSLNGNGGEPRLRRLHLYNIKGTDNTKLLSSLSVCRSLVDLKIVCFYRRKNKWKLSLESVSRHCPLLEHLIFETSPPDGGDGLNYLTSSEFVLNCPNITTLALKGFKVPDSMAHELVKGLHKLKYVDFSTSFSFTGGFLKNLGSIGGGNNLEVMILRDTIHLNKAMVKQFMETLVAGEWKSLRHLDISHTNDPKIYSFFRPFRTSSIRKQLLEQRPNIRLLAEFGTSDSEVSIDSTSSDESSDEDDY